MAISGVLFGGVPEESSGKIPRKLSCIAQCYLTAGFLHRAGAQTTQTFQKISEFLPERFSRRWIPKPQFWYPPPRFGFQHRIPEPLFFFVFLVHTADFGSSARGQIFFLVRLSPKLGLSGFRAQGKANLQ